MRDCLRYGFDHRFPIVAVICLFLGLAASQSALAQAPRQPSVRHTDYVLLIDNSASIRGNDRHVIREAVKLFIDLTEDNDRFSVILFGEGGRVALTQTFRSEAERDASKQQVDTEIDFSEQFSDLRAGVRVLSEQKEALFRGGDAQPVAVLLSDGKLEPPENDVLEAYEEMRGLLRTDLAGVPFFTVGMGTTAIHDDFLAKPKVNGLVLLRDVLAGASGQFYHAKNLDVIFETYMEILKQTKKLSDLDAKEGEFKTDESIASVTLVVRKQSREGEVICRSADLRLRGPDGNEVGAFGARLAYPDGDRQTRLIWMSDYDYFDLIMIRNPMPGIWKIYQESQEPLAVLSSVVAHIDLEHNIEPSYYLGVPIEWAAWLYDDRENAKSTADYQVHMKIAPEDAFDASEQQTEMHRTGDHPEYILRCPEDFPRGLEPGRYKIQLTARSRDDQYFFRHTSPTTVLLQEPFFEFGVPAKTKYYRLPFIIPALDLSVLLHREAETYPQDALPPEVTAQVTFSDKSGRQISADTLVLRPSDSSKPSTYTAGLPMRRGGAYQYAYTLEIGFPNRPNLTLTSAAYSVDVRSLVGIIIVCVVLAILGIAYYVARRSRSVLAQRITYVVTVEGKPIPTHPFQVKGRGRVVLSGQGAVSSAPRELRGTDDVIYLRPRPTVLLKRRTYVGASKGKAKVSKGRGAWNPLVGEELVTATTRVSFESGGKSYELRFR